MLNTIEIVVGLFPGQGAYAPNALQRLKAYGNGPAEAIEIIDDVARGMLGKGLDRALSGDSLERLLDEAPDVLQLAVFAASTAAHRALTEEGARFSVLVGHSLGEIAALVAGGALNVAEGAEILCHRVIALREHDSSGGGLLALGCAAERAQQILDLLPTSGAVIAVDNGPEQTVVSGPADALRRTSVIADAVGLSATALRAPHPFHSPLLAAAGQELGRRLTGYGRRGLDVPVFSPILGRYYRDSDDLGELLASHLVTPVRFGAAVERLHRSGAGVWVEVGAGRALTSRVRSAHRTASVYTPLLPDVDTLRETGRFLAPAATSRSVTVENPASRSVPADDSALRPVAVEDPAPRATPADGAITRVVTTGGTTATTATTATTQTVVAESLTVPAVPAEAESAVAQSREAIAARVRDLYATTLEYPEEVFEDHAELEADLGVDSVKRVELMSRLSLLFDLGPRPENLRMSDYRTFGQVVDFVVDSLAKADAA